MGVITQNHEFTSTIPPSILFKAMIFDFENVITKILPNIIKNVENIKGDGSKPGNIQRLIFFQGQLITFFYFIYIIIISFSALSTTPPINV